MTKRDVARMGKRSASIASRSTYRHRGQRAHAVPALSTLAVLIGSVLSGGAQANPSGGQVVAGKASIDHGPNTVNINQASDKAIINWQQFGINPGETVNFNQPGSQSVTLNRVVGNDPSAIYGSLNANGTVMLVNPNGIVFGAGSRVDVGGLVATTANIRDDDFMAGRYRFAQASAKPGAQVINEGQISIKDSGLAALVAPAVQNTGVIQAKLGKVALAGANSFTLDFQGDGLLSFDAGSVVDQLPRDASGKPVALVDNSGKIQADGGTVLLTASAVKSVVDNVINTTGIISATSVGSQNGKIVLSGGQAGVVAVGGALNAGGAAAGQQGGKIVVTGQHVAVAGQALLDVSGSAGGGEIALGSLGAAPGNGAAAFSGKSSSVKVAAGARLKADALVQGKGGTVTLWSEDATVHAGAISARGGEQGGDGGFAEVSSNKNIGLTGTADLRAPKGKTGLLLIDPTTLTIIDADINGGDQDGNAGSGTLNANADDTANNTVSRGLLESLAGNANIKLEATGLITVNAMASKLIDLQTTPGHSFTLRSTERDGIRFIDPQTEIRTQGGSIALEALGQGGTLDNIGKLSSNGGDITLTAAGRIRLAGDLNAGAGKVTVQSNSGSIRNSAADARPLLTGDTVTLSARLGDVGAAASALRTDTDELSLTTGGDLFIDNQATLSRLAIVSNHADNGVNSYQIDSTGLTFNLIDGSSYSLNTLAQNGLAFLFTGDRGLSIGTVDTGSTGSVALTSTAGGLRAQSGATLISGDTVTLKASGGNGGYTIGESSQTLNTAANTLKAEAGSIYIEQHGAVTLDGLLGSNTGQVRFTATAGDITLGADSFLNAGTLSLNAQAGSIFGNEGNALLQGQNVQLTARDHLGGTDRPISTVTSSLTVNGGGNIHIDNGQKTLTSLTIGNTHAAGQEQNTIHIASPHLGFDVQDDGSAYQLKQLYSASLSGLSFTGDRGLVLGSIKANGPVSLTSTLGDIHDDNLADTRVAGNAIALSASQGSIGAPGKAVETDTSSLTLVSGGDVHVDSISDLSSLNITHGHALSPSGANTLQVRAPSLTFDIEDDADGYRLNEVRDSYLNFSFNGDRSMTVGSIDAGHGGTIALTAQGGESAILDDESNTTILLANSVSLSAGGNIGQAGENKHLDIQTSSLQAHAESGGVYVRLPSPGGSTNYAGIVNLKEIYAGGGSVEIEALQGDLRQDYYSSITAANGGTITLTADHGSIGDAVNAMKLVGSARINAKASGDIHLRANNNDIESITLAEIEAGGSFSYRQTYGTTILGDVQSGGAVSIVNEYGNGLRDDGNQNTAVVSTGVGGASSITLSAASGSIGTSAAAVAINAPDLGLTSGGDINLTNAQAFQRLDITRTHYDDNASYELSADGQSFDISQSGGATQLKAISGGTGHDLDFGFTDYSGSIVVGQIETGAQGVVRLDSRSGNIVGQDATHHIAAKTVTLSAGQSIGDGSTEESAALELKGTEYLTLTAGRDIYVDSDTALKSLDITSTNSSVSAGSASRFGISAQGQAYALSDSGATQHLGTVVGSGLKFSFSGRKNIEVNSINVGGTGTVTLATSGGGVNSSISSKAGNSDRVIAQTVDLSAIGTGSSGPAGAIGSSSGALRLYTSNLKLESNGSVFIDNNNRPLDSVELYLSRRDASSATPVDNTYSFHRLGSNRLLSISDVSIDGSQTINATLNGTNLTVNTDASITVGNIDTGAGSVSLTSRYASPHFDPTIRNLDDNSWIIAGRISLDASGLNGSIGTQSAAIRTATTNLSLASAESVYVNNTDSTLTDLSLRALHNSSSGSTVNTYNLSSDGLTFNVTDSPSGLLLSNINTANGLKLSIASDRALTVDNISTGAGGSVTLDTSTIYGVSDNAAQPDISTGTLTLKGNTVQGIYNPSSNKPLYISVDKLSSNVVSSLRVSNNKTLTLLDNRSGGSASVSATAGSILQGSGSRYAAPVLELKAKESIGADGTALLTDTRQLSTSTGQDLYVNNGSNLFSLNIDSRHDGVGSNVVQVQASGLDLDIEDTGSAYNISRLADDTGIDFTLSTDTNVNVGVLNAGAGRSISLTAASTSSDASIANIDPDAHITAGTISLRADQNIGGQNNAINTTAYGLSLRAGGDMAVHNDLDLSSLALEISSASPSDRQYDISATGLVFNVGQDADRGIKINNVVDSSGLNFSVLSHHLDQHIGTIDVSPQGTVALSNNAGSLFGQAENSITASHITLQTLSLDNDDTIGDDDTVLNLSAPKLSITNSGSVYVASNRHMDALSIDSRGDEERSYAISSVARHGGESWSFNASDDGGSLFLEDIQDTAGMALTVISDRGIKVGDIDLGGLDNISLTARGDITDDDDRETLAHAANLAMTAQTGAIGARDNAIDTRVDGLSANSRGGVHLALNDHTRLNGITAYDDSTITNSQGDIALGTISLNGHGLSVLNDGGSILSGELIGTGSVVLKASGSIGNAGALSLSAQGSGTTTLSAEARANDRGALGSIALSESNSLKAENVSADGDITLTAGGHTGQNLSIGSIQSVHGDVSLTSTYGDINAINGCNAIEGKHVSLTAKYGSGRRIGGSGTRLNIDAPSLTIATPGSFYIDNAADMSDLRILRQTSATGGSGGSMSLNGVDGFSYFMATDSGNTTTLTTLTDASGLNFEYSAIGAIRVGQIDVASGSVALSTNPVTGTAGSITNSSGSSSLITAEALKVSANRSHDDQAPHINLNTQVGRVDASTGSGGNITLVQNGSLTLDRISSTGNVSVTALTGDLLARGSELRAGAGKTLTLDATSGHILSEDGTVTGTGALTLSAAHGIGTQEEALQISSPGDSVVTASVTGPGSLYLHHGTLGASLNLGQISTADGDIDISATNGVFSSTGLSTGNGGGHVSLHSETGPIVLDHGLDLSQGSNVTLRAADGVDIMGNINLAGDSGANLEIHAGVNGRISLLSPDTSVTTAGTQTYDGQLQLHDDTTLTGSTITLAQGAVVGAEAPAAVALTIAGGADITGDIGSAELALTRFSISGDATLHGNHIYTTGDQSYAGAVALAGSQAMTSSGGDIIFDGTLSGSHDLAVRAGAAYFSDVGNDGAGRLGGLTLATGGTEFNGAIYAESVTADGPVVVSGGRVDTTGTQTYNEQLRLQHDATLAGTTIALKDGAVAWAPMLTLAPVAAPSLAIVGKADITGGIGAAEQALAAFSVSGATAMNSGNVYTTGAQYYGGHVALGGDTSLNGSLITLAGGADSNMAPGNNAALTLNGDAGLAGDIGKNAALSSLTVSGAATLGAGSIATIGDQIFEGAAILSGNQRLSSLDGDIQFHDTLSGGRDLAIHAGTGSVRFDAAVGSDAAGRLGSLTLDTANGAFFSDLVYADSVHVDGDARVAGGRVDTTGGQTYNGQLQLQHDAMLAGTTITLKQGAVAAMPMLMLMSTNDAAAPSLSIAGNADITGDIGTIDQALAFFTVGGTTALRQSGVHTAGAQNYAGHVVLQGDISLNGSLISFAGGADSTAGASAVLAINGDAGLAGDIGKAQALAGLTVHGKTTLGEGSITTLGQQAYQGPVTLSGQQALQSRQAGITFADTLSSADLANLSLGAADSINVQGEATGLGDLTLSARNTIVFNNALSAYRIVQLESGSSTFHGTVTALGEGGIAMSGGDFTFDQAVTAGTGAIALNNKAASTIRFAQDGAVNAATGFTQTGGGTLRLPASLQVAKGPISITALASLPSGTASIKTDGAITIAGLYGPDTRLTMASGTGAQTIGLNNGDTRYKINVTELIVPNAGSATMYGTVAGYDNAQAAQHITSALVGPPYYINGMPWGPVTADTINRITSGTTPQTIVPSTPGADSLFRHAVQPEGVGPDALAPYRDPQVLTLAQFDGTRLRGEPHAGQNDQSDDAGHQ